MPGEDRLTALIEQAAGQVTGIDFVQVVDPQVQRVLHVYFVNDPEGLEAGFKFSEAPIEASDISIDSVSGGERLARAQVVSVVNTVGEGSRNVLAITVEEPGDFSRYRLFIDDNRIDRFFNAVGFSFKQGCPSDVDCEPPEPECPPEALVDFPVDYLARDFVSIRSALLDFAAQRYPDWTEKIEADAGVMLAEVMAALGDELSYIQDRYAREAFLETASQRRSLRHHSRLVDYNIHDGLTAGTFLDLQVKPAPEGTFVAAGQRVWAPGQGGSPIAFELGRGLADTTADDGGPTRFWVHADWNAMAVHRPDEGELCLPVGTTELYLLAMVPTADQLPDGEELTTFWVGRWLLLQTDPEDAAIPARRHLVRLEAIEQTTDSLCLDDSNNPIAVTRIRWEDAQALPFEMCLSDLSVHGNIVFATAGETFSEVFVVSKNEDLSAAPKVFYLQDGVNKEVEVRAAVERQGPLDDVACRRSITFLHSLIESESRGLGWLGKLRDSVPEIELQEVDVAVDSGTKEVTLSKPGTGRIWQWQRTLLNVRGFHDAFTLDDGSWRRVIGFQRIGEVIEHADYASGAGFTIRFGDGEFGRMPTDGTVFRVRYRTGPGALANLPADTVVNLTHPVDDQQADLAELLAAVSNPLPVISGVDAEDAEVIKQIAPEAFRAETFRAVRPEDYAEIAERLPWVQRAGARFRWTGSWLSAFVTADELGAYELSPERRTELEANMDCVRQAGREVFVRDPRFVNIDLEIHLCVAPSAYPGQVKARVLEALLGRQGVRPVKGFFDPDHFTFGTPLHRASLEAAIQDVAGVRGVEQMRIRARGITDWRPFTELVFTVSDDRIIRLQNDPRFPERGSLRILTLRDEQAALEVNTA